MNPQKNIILPKGLLIKHEGNSLETVSSHTGRMDLLVSAGDVEIAQVVLEQGGRLFLVPPEDSTQQVTETYFVLSGCLECSVASAVHQVGPGGYIVVSDLYEQVALLAMVETQLLYITNKPFFHEISKAVTELMNLAVEVELKDGYTADHCRRLQELSNATGQELGLSATSLYHLNYGAYLHDVGKVKVPIEILQKPSKLDPDEWTIIKQHPSFGRELLEPTFMNVAAPIVEQHHERLDGSGYPYGLAGDNIRVESYIVAVADTYDAMTTDRSYRKALSPELAFTELEKYADIHYPEEVVKAFFSAVKRTELAAA